MYPLDVVQNNDKSHSIKKNVQHKALHYFQLSFFSFAPFKLPELCTTLPNKLTVDSTSITVLQNIGNNNLR